MVGKRARAQRASCVARPCADCEAAVPEDFPQVCCVWCQGTVAHPARSRLPLPAAAFVGCPAPLREPYQLHRAVWQARSAAGLSPPRALLAVVGCCVGSLCGAAGGCGHDPQVVHLHSEGVWGQGQGCQGAGRMRFPPLPTYTRTPTHPPLQPHIPLPTPTPPPLTHAPHTRTPLPTSLWVLQRCGGLETQWRCGWSVGL